MNLLGLGGGSGGGAGAAYGGSFTAGGDDNPFVTLGSDGVPQVNAQLYASDPAYKKAWDQGVQEHQNQWGKSYQKDSSESVINSRLAQLYAQYGGKTGTAGYETAHTANVGGATPAA